MPRPLGPRSFRPQALFRPRAIAVLGGGTELGQAMLRNLRDGGFAGALHVDVDLALLPETPDLGLVAAPDPQPCLDALSARGVPVAIVASPGDCAPGGCRVLGPGAFGVIVPAAGLNLSSAHVPVRAGKLALVSPSVALCRIVIDWAGPNGVGFSHVVGTGLEADIDAALILDFLSRESGTGAIVVDIRAIRDRRAFLSAARAAARLRPVVAIRAGARQRDPTGRSDAVFEAALRRAGVLHVGTMAELLAAAEILTRARPPRGEGLMVVSNALGAGQLAADQAVRLGIPLACPEPAARTLMRIHLPPQPDDPGLVWTGEQPTRLAEAVAMLAALPEIGGIVAILAPTGERDAAGVAALAACQPGLKLPVLACALGETTGAGHRRTLAEAGMPVFASPEQAVRGFAQLVLQRRARAAARELPSSRVLQLAPDLDRARGILAAARGAGRLALFQDEALQVLAAYGLRAVPTRVARGAERARNEAVLLGFPVVIKRRRLDPAGPGAAALDLRDAAAARRAASRLAQPDGLLVQRQAGRARRLRITVADDPLFGPAIGFGPGGRDRLADAVVELPPLNLTLAAGLVARSAAARLLGAGEGHAAADPDAVADALVRVSQLVIDLPEILALTIDPLFADEGGVAAAEAWIALRPPGERGVTAIAPYPADLVERWQAGGEEVEIRPIRPEDAAAHGALFHRLGPEDVRYRFFSLLRDLSPEQIARFTQVDYDREMALIAVRGGETVGVARLVREPAAAEGEFAVAVDPAMKGRGLGRHLMTRIVDWGRAQGLAVVTGQILADNAPMLAFIRRLGFEVRRIPGESDVVEARLAL